MSSRIPLKAGEYQEWNGDSARPIRTSLWLAVENYLPLEGFYVSLSGASLPRTADDISIQSI